MLSLSVNQSWRSKVFCLLALMIGMSVLIPATQAFQEEEAVVEAVVDDAPAEEVITEEAEEAEEAGYYDKAESNYITNTLFMMVCAVLVILMQPGFALLEVGLNAKKNTVNILFKNVMDLSVGVLLYFFIGWGIMYPGDVDYFAFAGIGVAGDTTDAAALEYGFSNSVDFLFQVAFAATAATIVSGAVAGRMKFGAYLTFSALLTGLIYPISGAWKWGGGFLDQAGFQDFAGSVVVHAVGGFAGLAGAIALGPRLGRFTDGKSTPLPGQNITFAAIGVFLLWVGWYGFNPGSQLTYGGLDEANATTYIALTTTLAAAAGAVTAMIIAWLAFGKPDVTMALNGVLAGLVSITANCDQVSTTSALIIGVVGGVLVVGGIVALDKLKIDDPVGAWPVHGLCGVWGGLATGLFGTGSDLARGEYIWVQLYSTVIICVWAFVTMYAVFMVLKAAGMLRVSREEEEMGLDLSEHGMRAYGDSLA